jgi:glutathione-specific gamma-glutamylcyclotransferase
MPETIRQMALTAELVASVTRFVEDSGPIPGHMPLTDEDYDLAVRTTLAHAPAGDIWVFAYGSLLWKPACEVAESQNAVVKGWHRAFCMRVPRFRGTPEKPGLMMALDRGGQCQGKILQVPAQQIEESMGKLFRREMSVKPYSNRARWLSAATSGGTVRAIGFVMDRQSPRYSGRLALEEVADVLSTAAGHWGSGAEYLYNTVSHLEEYGIHDRYLWRLQALVAERIRIRLAQ